MTKNAHSPARYIARLIVALACLIVVSGRGSGLPDLQAQDNPVRAENLLPGDVDWDVPGSGHFSIQGFASDMSVNVGATIDFKIDTASTNYRIDIYRLGYYNGAGARKVATIANSSIAKLVQPSCLHDASTGLVDCGNWGANASWSVPANAVSGVYIARPTRQDGNAAGQASHIYFIVRDDSRVADIIMQTSDTTWQAYNLYGGNSLYCGAPYSNEPSAYACPARAVKVSYNRPFDTRAHDPQSFLFSAEYPMIRFLEANGYDVKYWSGVDTDRIGANLGTGLTSAKKPKIFVSVGHDEYWSGTQRTNVENARNAGVNLAFMSGNEIYWKTRWEPSLPATVGGPTVGHRTLVTYKETLNNAKIDPGDNATIEATDPWTGTWRDTRFSPPSDGGRPENALIGSIWTVNSGSGSIQVPAAMSGLRLWRNTRVANLQPGQVASLGNGTLGYEWGEALENGVQPPGLVRLSSTTKDGVEKIIDFGSNVGFGTATHTLTLYKHQSGALVFGASTVQWSWGLDGIHDQHNQTQPSNTPDQAIQQATVNLFADMGVQPASLQAGADPQNFPLQTTPATADITAPTSSITSPAGGGQVESGNRIIVTGTAVDAGGGAVGGVEVSVDGGATWHKANGTSNWTYEWIPGVVGPGNLRSRAIDDSGNIENAGAGVSVSIVVGECPCTSLWKETVVPAVASYPDSNEYELGVKFQSDIDGFITGIRFYKGPSNNGTHAGSLWNSNGDLLATAVFTNESATGWQQVNFATPVAILANTQYVASYHTPQGGYAVDVGYFGAAGVNSPPLRALPSAQTGGTGVIAIGPRAFPTIGLQNNYWVDVVFAQSLDDDTAPVITQLKSTTIDGSRVSIGWKTNEPSTTRVDYGTDPAIQTATLDSLPPGTQTVGSPDFVTQHSLMLTGLQANTTYYYLASSSDGAGNVTTEAAPSFTVPGPTLRDTAATDFAAGTVSSTYVSQSADGEVMLAPGVGTEFTGPSLPEGWVSANWGSGGSAKIIGGVLEVDGARVASCASPEACAAEAISSTHGDNLFAGPRVLEFSARYSGDQFQHAGFGQTFSSSNEPWAIFSTLSGGNLFARTNTGVSGFAMDTMIGVAPLGEFHEYRVDWKADRVDYYIDDVLVVTHPLAITGSMRPVAASDLNPFGGIIFVDWMRMLPTAAAGSFESRIFDATSIVNWKAIQWKANVPAGTTLQISVRTGSTPTPDGNWTAWVPATPGPLSLTSQFIQYRAEMTTSNPFVTPELQDIIITTGNAPVAVNDSVEIARNSTHTFPASGLGSLVANDTDADPNDRLHVVSVTAASHGLATLNANGSVSYTPAPNYFGPDVFTYTMSDGLLTSSATVSVTVHENNVPPVANHDLYHMQEDTTLFVPGRGVLINDTDVDNNPLTAALVTAPAHGMLTLNQGGSFTYTPPANFAGPITFTYRVFDGEAFSQPATVAIEIAQVNDPPYTVEDTFFALLNQPLDVAAPGVLANDRDVEVEDINPLTAQLITGPSHGTLTLNANGSFSYVPETDYLGTDSFVYASVDHFGAVSLIPKTVTLTVALKAVSAALPPGGTVNTGGAVSPGDPLRSEVTTPTPATVAIAQGVIAGTSSPTGYTFLNQQVNITVTGLDGLEVTASPANPLKFVFEIDLSIAAGQTHDTFQIFRNNVLVPNCLGATSIPAANLDPCVSKRENGTRIKLTVLTTHASSWNMGVSTDTIDELKAVADGPFPTNYETPLTRVLPGVLYNDFGGAAITAHLVAGSEIGGTVLLEPNGAFEFTPAAGFCGPASFQYRVGAGGEFSAPALVTLPVNCRPIANNDTFTVLEDSGINTFTVLSNDTDPDGLPPFTIIAVTQGAKGTVMFSGAPANMFVSYAPALNVFGSDSFTYTIRDSKGDTATGTVNVDVLAVNDAPSFVKGADQNALEDAALQTVPGWATAILAGPANEGGQALSFTTNSNNAALFSTQPSVSPSGTLTYQPAPDAYGSAVVTVSLQDDGGTANFGVATSGDQTFTITVGGVNDVPSFTKGADQSMFEDTGAQSIANWASSISAGPANESSQAVDFLVSNDNNALFSQQPAVSPAGTLTFDPAPNAYGSAIVSVRIHDNGGTANGGVDTSAAQTFTITVSLLNDAPSFTPGANQTVNEDAGAQSIAWATNVSAGPADEASQALTFVIDSNSNAALFSVLPSLSNNGTLSYTPAPNANGTATLMVRLTDNGGTLNGGVNTSAAHALVITVNAVNDAPSFVKGADQTVLVNSGLKTVPAWATAISAGPANEAGQALTFTVTNSNNALFSGQPAVASNGTLTFTPAPGMTGSATVTVTLGDNGGTTNGGVNISASQTFTISVVQGTTATTVSSSNTNALFGTSVTLTATVAPVPTTTLAGGTVTFRRGTTVIGTAPLTAANTATLTTTTLPVGTHSVTAVFGGTAAYLGSTSAAISQVVSPSATIQVNFTIYALDDNSKRPKVTQTPVEGATVRVYRRWEPCTSTQYVSVQPKKWGIVFDGADGEGPQEGCPVVTHGTYRAEGVTDANGNVNIIVPPTSSSPNIDYLVIGKSLDFDVTTTPTEGDPIYAAFLVPTINSGQSKKAPLLGIRLFNGKHVAAKTLEEFGSYLGMVQPEHIEWTEDETLYPVILVAEGEWDVTTSVATPSGFVPDETTMSTAVADTVTAMQFLVTDIGSEWTPTTVTHVVKHNGTTRVQSMEVQMINKKPTRAKIDYFTVDPGSSANVLEVLVNDNVAPPKTLRVTGVTPGINGGAASVSPDGLTVLYTPAANFVGQDSFTYTIEDSLGATSTGTVKMRVNDKPSLVINDITFAEGNLGSARATFTVTLSKPSDNEISFDYATVDGTAIAGKDFSFSSGTATLRPGETTKTVSVQIIGNTAYQGGDRRFTMKLWLDAANKSNAVVFGGAGTATIVEDDPKPNIVASTDLSVLEGQSGTTLVPFTVTLEGQTTLPVTVSYVTVNGFADAGFDFVGTSGILTFEPGESSKTFNLTVKGDTTIEAAETFFVTLSMPVNGALPVKDFKITILDDDATSWVHTTAADFATGTMDAGTYISQTANGEIILAPALGSEFAVAGIPPGWATTVVAAGGSATVASKKATIDGAALISGGQYGAGGSFEFSATFTGAAGQWGGFSGTGTADTPFAMIGTRVANTLVARTVNGAAVQETPIVGSFYNAANTFRVEWNATSVVFWVNNKKVATHTVAMSAPMRPSLLDSVLGGGVLIAQYARMSPYAPSGSFTSRVFDAGGPVTWSTVAWTQTIAAGTSIAIQYRTGNTPTPDETWTSFTAVPLSGGALSGTSRYFQFIVRETTTDSKATPVVKDVTVTFRR